MGFGSTHGNSLQDVGDDLVDRHAGRVDDDGVVGLGQWAVNPGRVDPITFDDGGLDLDDVAAELADPRSARTRGDAVTYSFRSASGNTTVPMSRPSTTPPPCRSTQRR